MVSNILEKKPGTDKIFSAESSQNLNFIILSIKIIFSCTIADQVTKFLLEITPEKRELITGVLGLTDHKNYGIIANISVPESVIIILTIGALYLVLKALVHALADKNGVAIQGLSFIMAGALGNLIDRVFRGYVYDWILLFNTSILNLADIFIVFGIIIFLYSQFKATSKIEL